jgi:hypothetical protein
MTTPAPLASALDTAVARLLPETQRAESALRKAAATLGITYTVAKFGGLRTEADTTRIMGFRDTDYAKYVADLKRTAPTKTPLPKARWRPIAPFGSSYHNYGAALDLTILTRPQNMTAAGALAALGALAPQFGLRWGGTFSLARRDPPHFELAIPLPEAKRLWLARNPSAGVARPGGSAVPLLLVVAFVGLIVLARMAKS